MILIPIELNVLAAEPAHRHQGAGSMLFSWAFERADKEGIVCYPQTEADNEGTISLYRRLGFVKVDECSPSLGLVSGTRLNTHIAMVRKPKAGGQGVTKEGGD